METRVNKKIEAAIDRIKKASLLIIGGEPEKYANAYKEVKPSGSVAEAWKAVGDNLKEVIDETKREENDGE